MYETDDGGIGHEDARSSGRHARQLRLCGPKRSTHAPPVARATAARASAAFMVFPGPRAPPCWFWLPPPALDAAAGAYTWARLELRPSAGRGLGVFATGALPAGLLLPYGGLEVSPARLRWLAKYDRDRYVARTSPGPAAGGVDGWTPTQRTFPPGTPSPGSRLNEASPGELYNCIGMKALNDLLPMRTRV